MSPNLHGKQSSFILFSIEKVVATRSKAWDFACWDSVFGSFWGQVCLFVVSVVCCQVQVSVSGRSLVQRSPTECGVSEFDREASIIRRSWPTRGCCALEKCRNDKQNNKLGSGLPSAFTLFARGVYEFRHICLSLCLFTRIYCVGSDWTDFRKI